MAKKANLANALDDVTPPPVAPVQRAEPESLRAAPIPSRKGTMLIGAHLPTKYGKAMKLLSAETDKSQRDLFEEALDMLLVKYGGRGLRVDR
jgi:hypothetical protein